MIEHYGTRGINNEFAVDFKMNSGTNALTEVTNRSGSAAIDARVGVVDNFCRESVNGPSAEDMDEVDIAAVYPYGAEELA